MGKEPLLACPTIVPSAYLSVINVYPSVCLSGSLHPIDDGWPMEEYRYLLHCKISLRKSSITKPLSGELLEAPIYGNKTKKKLILMNFHLNVERTPCTGVNTLFISCTLNPHGFYLSKWPYSRAFIFRCRWRNFKVLARDAIAFRFSRVVSESTCTQIERPGFMT